MFKAERWGFFDMSKTKKEKARIAKAACKQVSYDRGFKASIGWTQLTEWRKNINDMIDGVSVNMKDNPLDSNHRGTKKYTDEIDKRYPGYLVQLFRYAQKTAGAKAGFVVLAETMNLKSAIESDNRPTLNLHHLQVYRWFVSKGGKESSPIEKPLDTPAHKK